MTVTPRNSRWAFFGRSPPRSVWTSRTILPILQTTNGEHDP